MFPDTPSKVVSLAEYRKRKRAQEEQPLPKDRSLVVAEHATDTVIYSEEIPEDYFPDPCA